MSCSPTKGYPRQITTGGGTHHRQLLHRTHAGLARRSGQVTFLRRLGAVTVSPWRGNVRAGLGAGSKQEVDGIPRVASIGGFYTDSGRRPPKTVLFDPFPEGEDNGWDKQAPLKQKSGAAVERASSNARRGVPLARTLWTDAIWTPASSHLTASLPAYKLKQDSTACMGKPTSVPLIREETEVTFPLAATLYVSQPPRMPTSS